VSGDNVGDTNDSQNIRDTNDIVNYKAIKMVGGKNARKIILLMSFSFFIDRI
jgi:hypothetical protein